MARRIPGLIGVTAAIAVALATLIGVPGSGAQASRVDQQRPAQIHRGTCDALGDVAYPLNEVATFSAPATPGAAIASPMPSASAVPQSVTVVEVPLDDLLASEHAINVQETAGNADTSIACGEITGKAGAGQVVIALREMNSSGYAGVAILLDHGDGTTKVSVSLTPADLTVASPVATPAG